MAKKENAAKYEEKAGGARTSPSRRILSGRASPSETVAKLLPEAARRKAAENFPSLAGASFFYEIGSGWETRILEQDGEVKKVQTVLQLEDAFADLAVKTILTPKSAGITRTAAIRVCKRYGQDKTVFFERPDHEQR
jgi:hypothetical protein